MGPFRPGGRVESEVFRKFKAGILGATGVVGQRLLCRLENHPWFRPEVLGASDRSQGALYGRQVRWSLDAPIPETVRGMTLQPCVPERFERCDLVFSSLGSEVAREVEGDFLQAGFKLISNSSAYRMEPTVPLVIPEVNAGHLRLLDREKPGGDEGWIVTNPNCSVTGLALVLAPLHAAFGVEKVVVTTLQALSGAGLSAPSREELFDNVLPYIRGEEEKIQEELPKILGGLDRNGPVRPAEMAVAAHCNRVATVDGHLETVSVGFSRTPSVDEAEEVLRNFRGAIEGTGLPSAPERPIRVRPEPDRPQPRLDRDAAGGMAAVVGRVRRCPVLDLRFTLLAHNAERGAAGAAVLNGELLASRGRLGREVPDCSS